MISQTECMQLRLDGQEPKPIRKPRQPFELTPLVDQSYIVAPPSIEVQEHLTTLRLGLSKENPYQGVRRTRGKVVAFSKSSRLRLMRTLSAVRWSTLPPPAWCTLTYHHADDVSSERAVHDLQVWLHFVQVKVGKCHYLWRLEMQKRGVPHFHVILWPASDAPAWQTAKHRQWLESTWHQVVSPGDKAHARHGAKVLPLDSYRHASRYISKYVSKEANADSDTYRGRRWATSHKLPMDILLSSDLSGRAALLLRRKLRKYLRSTTRNRAKTDAYVMSQSCLRVFIPHNVVTRMLTAVLDDLEDEQDGPPPWNPEF